MLHLNIHVCTIHLRFSLIYIIFNFSMYSYAPTIYIYIYIYICVHWNNVVSTGDQGIRWYYYCTLYNSNYSYIGYII